MGERLAAPVVELPILASISWEAGVPCPRCSRPSSWVLALSSCVGCLPVALHASARQSARLLDPSDELAFVELVVLADVQVASAIALGLAGRNGA